MKTPTVPHIQITTGAILEREFSDALKRLSREPMPFKLSYAIGKTMRELRNIEASYQNDRIRLVRELGEEAGAEVKVKAANMDEFTRRIMALKDKVNSLWLTGRIILPDETRISPVDVVTLSGFLQPPAEFDEIADAVGVVHPKDLPAPAPMVMPAPEPVVEAMPDPAPVRASKE